MSFDAQTLQTRPHYEQVADESGWVPEKHSTRTVFRRDGWTVRVTWTDGSRHPGSLVVVDPLGHVARSMTWLRDGWEIGGELLRQLDSPGPLRAPQLPLSTLIAGYAAVFEETERVRPGYAIPVQAVAARLREFLEEAS